MVSGLASISAEQTAQPCRIIFLINRTDRLLLRAHTSYLWGMWRDWSSVPVFAVFTENSHRHQTRIMQRCRSCSSTLDYRNDGGGGVGWWATSLTSSLSPSLSISLPRSYRAQIAAEFLKKHTCSLTTTVVCPETLTGSIYSPGSLNWYRQDNQQSETAGMACWSLLAAELPYQIIWACHGSICHKLLQIIITADN